ncbi:MAG: hypothetical protein E7487_11205 [Ruminococcaceae bacterium]|nr:hypothetical protein [Oscillospiraceae bacterium]
MEQYEVFYRDTFLGMLSVNTQSGQHMFRPNREGGAAVCRQTSLIREITEGTDGSVPPIPFFYNRLKEMKRWDLNEINYQTDYFLIRKCE